MRERRKTSRLTWGVLIFIVMFMGFAAWELLLPHVYEPGGTITVAEATALSRFRIPAEARNIRVASWRHWMFFDRYLRFEAPVDVCVKAAEVVLAGGKLEVYEVGAFEGVWPSELGTIHRARFRDLSWFDLENARDMVGGGGGPGKPRVWVDRRRGVFYWRESD